ncbi:MAG: starch-binding protein [Oscillospiraceae bacterium]|nr:starch-binding protein [Oscillospiraceae bacterium]
MKTQKKLLSLLLAVMMICTSFALSAFTASAADAGSRVYFDNSVYQWDNVHVYVYGTKGNGEWPGEPMELDESGLYTKSFSADYASEKVIFNNGVAGDEGKEQYPAPKAAGLSLKAGECKLLTADLQWIDYGAADDHGHAYANVADGTSFVTDSLNVKLGLIKADKGYYSIDGSPKTEFTDGAEISVGQGKIGNSKISLVLTATGEDGVETEQTYTYKKMFTETKTTFSAKSDGHTTEAEGGYYGTNPNMQLGKYKTITVDGKVDDWDSSMIIAQGVANDDSRVYMPSAMHEPPMDNYALYCAWDDDNLYFMWEMANTTKIILQGDNFATSNEARPWRNDTPLYLALSIDPTKQATGPAVGTNKDGSTYTNPFVWGCEGGLALKGGTGFTTHIDTLIANDAKNSNGGASIFKADTLADDGTYLFNYDTRIPIGIRSFEAQDNQNGFQFKYDYGTKSDTLYGINAPMGSRVLGDNTNPSSNFVDFFDLGYKKSNGYIYEVGIPLSLLGIDRDYIETKGIGAMQILTYGTSAVECLPHDPTTLDNANVPYGPDPSTSHEKEDIDNITVPLARIGAFLPDTVVTEAPFEVNFGADRSSGQAANTLVNLSAVAYHGKGDLTYDFTVNGESIQNSSSSTAAWTPSETGTYTIGVTVTDSEGNICKSSKTFTVGDSAVVKILGDVDGNGKLNIFDATAIQLSIAEMPVEPYDETVADFNCDGFININDATDIQLKIAEAI